MEATEDAAVAAVEEVAEGAAAAGVVAVAAAAVIDAGREFNHGLEKKEAEENEEIQVQGVPGKFCLGFWICGILRCDCRSLGGSRSGLWPP